MFLTEEEARKAMEGEIAVKYYDPLGQRMVFGRLIQERKDLGGGSEFLLEETNNGPARILVWESSSRFSSL